MRYVFAIVTLLLALCGCTEETAILVFVDSDIDLDRVQIEVTGTDGIRLDPASVTENFQTSTRPVRLTLVPDDAHPLGRSFEIEVKGFMDGDDVVDRTAVTSFSDGETLFLKLYLYAACVDVNCDTMGEGLTCIADDGDAVGRCEDELVRGQEYTSDPTPILTPIPRDGGTPACDPSTCWEGCLPTGAPCDPVVQLSAGGAHTCARTEQGDVYCWGFNTVGQLGNGLPVSSAAPARVLLPDGVTAIDVSAGLDHSCAVVDRGTGNNEVYCWGDNFDGQLGTDDVPEMTATPVKAEGLDSVDPFDVAAGGLHTCLLAGDGSMAPPTYCTGDDDAAQLGSSMGMLGDRRTFAYSTHLLNSSMIDAGEEHTCLLQDGGQVSCWGESDSGRLGNNVDGSAERNPAGVLDSELMNLGGVESLSLGKSHTCVITDASSQLFCFGSGEHGELGNGILSDVLIATTQPEDGGSILDDWTAVSAGVLQTCGIRQSAIWCWGWSNDGALGLGGGNNEQTPQLVDMGERPVGGEATLIALGGGDDPMGAMDPVTHACALVEGLVYCWGDNEQGQVEVGASALIGEPMRVPSPPQ